MNQVLYLKMCMIVSAIVVLTKVIAGSWGRKTEQLSLVLKHPTLRISTAIADIDDG